MTRWCNQGLLERPDTDTNLLARSWRYAPACEYPYQRNLTDVLADALASLSRASASHCKSRQVTRGDR
jgi:hypothetical protein